MVELALCVPVKWRLAGMLPREWRKCTLSAELILNPMTGVIIEIIENLTLECIKTAVFLIPEIQKVPTVGGEGGQPLSHTHTPLGQLAPSLSYLPLFSNISCLIPE